MCQDGTLYYVLGDQLGSANVTLDSSGNVVGETRYYPFGQTRYATGSMFTDKLYTGQRFEDYINLYWYNSRWYDSVLGRFTQADTMIPDPGSSTAYDRYAYVQNNPLKYSDPSGHYFTQPEDAIINSNTSDGRIYFASRYFNFNTGAKVAKAALDNDGVNDPHSSDWDLPDDNACTLFASKALSEAGVMEDKDSWSDPNDLYKELVTGEIFGKVTVLDWEIVPVGGSFPSIEEIQKYLYENYLQAGAFVFYDVDDSEREFSHMAIATGNLNGYAGMLTPEITDMSGEVQGPSSILDTGTFHLNLEGTDMPYRIVIVIPNNWVISLRPLENDW